jgi:hypothetical protein
MNPAAQVTIVSGDDPAAPGITVEVDDVDAMYARAAAQGHDISHCGSQTATTRSPMADRPAHRIASQAARAYRFSYRAWRFS